MNTESQLALEICSGSQAGETYVLGQGGFIGSGGSCDFYLTDKSVEAMHARIRRRGSSYVLTDLTAQHDVKLNGVLVKSRGIKLGDSITIAGVELKVIDADAESAGLGPGGEKDIVLVAMEDDPKTEVIRGIIGVTPSADETGRLDDIEDDLKDHDVVEEEATPNPLAEYKRAAAQRMSSKGNSKKGLFVTLTVIIVLALIGVSIFVGVGLSEKKKIETLYLAANDFAQKNPGQYQALIDNYDLVLDQAIGKHKKLEVVLENRIDALVAEQKSKKKKLEALLVSLDKKSDALASDEKFGEAIAVFKNVKGVVGNRVREERKERMASLTSRGKLLASHEAKRAVSDAQEVQKLERAKAEADLVTLASSVADALIAGHCDAATAQLTRVVDEERFAFAKEKARSALITVQLLKDYDVSTQEEQDADEDKEKDDAALRAALPPIARGIVAIREGDLYQAKTCLKGERRHLLYSALSPRANIAEDQRDVEKAAIQFFGKAYGKFLGKTVTVIPKPEECLKQLKEAVDNRDHKDLLAPCGELVTCKKEYEKTKFVMRYAAVLAEAERLHPQFALETRAESGVGNARIIQVDGNAFYVELKEEEADLAKMRVGLFVDDAVFLSPVGNVPVATRIKVYEVLPLKVLSERQLSFQLPEGVRRPATGDNVLVENDLKVGPKFMNVSAVVQKEGVVYKSDFTMDMLTTWAASKRRPNLDVGRLRIGGHRTKRGARSDSSLVPDAELEVPLGIEPVSISFDLIRDNRQAVVVGLGPLQFVVGGYGIQKQGIYARRQLLMPAAFPDTTGKSAKIAIEKKGSRVTFAVDGHKVECDVDTSVAAASISKMVFYSRANIFLDNMMIRKLGSTTSGGGIVGFNADKSEVIIKKPLGREWKALGRGSVVYFHNRGDGRTTKAVGSASAQQALGTWLLCSVTVDKGIAADSVVALTPVMKSSAVAVSKVKSTQKEPPALDILFAARCEGDKQGKFVIDTPGNAPSKGVAYIASALAQQPQTREVIGAVPAAGVPVAILQNGAFAELSGPKLSALDAAKHIILSTSELVPGRTVELPCVSRVSSKSPLTSFPSRPSFWKVMQGEWKEKLGKISYDSSEQDNVVGILAIPEAMSGNVQYDVELSLLKKGAQSENDWVRDVMIEFFVPACQEGVTFGLGAADGDSLIVSSSAISLDPLMTGMTEYDPLPNGVVVMIDPDRNVNPPVLQERTTYRLRIRRIGERLAFYVNGKRLALVHYPGFWGASHLLIAAPEGTVSIKKASVLKLPRSCKVPAKEPDLGEFGYVLSIEGDQCLVDADMNGMSKGSIVSITAVDKVIKGKDSKTVLMKRVAKGVVKEIGPRMARIVVSRDLAKVKPGMKVFVGLTEASFSLTYARLRDLAKGL